MGPQQYTRLHSVEPTGKETVTEEQLLQWVWLLTLAPPTVQILFLSPWEVEVTLVDRLCHCKVLFSLLFLARTIKRVIKTVPAPALNLATVES